MNGRPPSATGAAFFTLGIGDEMKDGATNLFVVNDVRRLSSRGRRLQAALEQIAIVCTDNMDRDKDHRMALDFVRQIANDVLTSALETK